MDNCNYDTDTTHREKVYTPITGAQFGPGRRPHDPYSIWTLPETLTFGSWSHMKEQITFATYSQSAALRQRRISGRDFIQRFSALSLDEQPYHENFGTIQPLSEGPNRSYFNYNFPSCYSSTALYSQTSLHSQVFGFHQQKCSASTLPRERFFSEKPRPMSYPFASARLLDLKDIRATAVGSVKPRKRSPDFPTQFYTKSWTKRRKSFSEDFSEDDDDVHRYSLMKLKPALIDGEEKDDAEDRQQTSPSLERKSFFRSTTFFVSVLLNIVLMSWLVFINYDLIADAFWRHPVFTHAHLGYDITRIWLGEMWESFNQNYNLSLGLDALHYVKLFYFDAAIDQPHFVDESA